MYGQCAIKRKSSRILSILLAVVMVLSVTVLPAAAATAKTKSVTSTSGQLSKMTNFKVTSGKGILYSLGIKKTTVTVKNLGRYSVYVYEKNAAGLLFYKGTLGAGQTWNLSMSGSAKTSTLYFQRGRGNTTVSVSVNAGSVS